MLHKSLPCSSLFEGAMSSNGRLVGSSSRRNAEQFPEARLVRITRRGAAIGVNPVGMLDPQIVVNLLLELGVGVCGSGETWQLADLECSFVLSSSVAIAFKWRGLAPRRHRLLRIVVRVAWPWCVVR